MLGYISSTRKKSCYSCVKSKRRCDLGYPFCKRCFVKGIDCQYPGSSPRESSKSGSVVIRQTTTDFAEPPAATTSSSSDALISIDTIANDANLDPLLFLPDASSGSSSSPESFDELSGLDDWGWEIPKVMPYPQPHLTRMLMPEYEVPSYLNEAQVTFIIHGMCSFVPAMAYAGSTAFLHKNLYQDYEPQAYQDCVAICALYLTKTVRNRHILANSINAKIAGMITESASWTLPQHLAAVQALTIYQIIRLYDLELNLQEHAAKHNRLLELWSATLWKRAFTEEQSFSSTYTSWIFHESLRRTIMMSVFLRCGWSCLTKGGLADQVPVLARLPLTKDLEAWKCEQEDWSVRSLSFMSEEESLITYGDMSGRWSAAENKVEELDAFGRLLLAACRGKDDPRLLA
ncbi:hypothetical protein FB567DRAFT_136850 [Paraphoma chrysanthemicola]|uniref:Zn(2)-C6 fungal-type domain-containing protein n=1 Tax=Paraphoma chrysanthemicola TaxID=798071 RepID=A0A8K0VVN5_9PLEO|nr:hypothetical protein FB567DRAFT_136850 [Paraphoma chrysanthemicola]